MAKASGGVVHKAPDEMWDASFKTFARLPMEYKAQCLCRWNAGLDQEFLNTLESECPASID